MVQKSNSGKKKHNPYRTKEKVPTQEEIQRQESEAMIKKANKGWVIFIAIYFVSLIITSMLQEGTLPWLITQGIGYLAMLLWGILLVGTSRYYQIKGTAGLYKVFGVILIVLSAVQLSILIPRG